MPMWCPLGCPGQKMTRRWQKDAHQMPKTRILPIDIKSFGLFCLCQPATCILECVCIITVIWIAGGGKIFVLVCSSLFVCLLLIPKTSSLHSPNYLPDWIYHSTKLLIDNIILFILMVILKISLLKPKNHEMFRMCGDLSLEKQTSISRTNMNPTTEEILPEKVTSTVQLIIFKQITSLSAHCRKGAGLRGYLQTFIKEHKSLEQEDFLMLQNLWTGFEIRWKKLRANLADPETPIWRFAVI